MSRPRRITPRIRRHICVAFRSGTSREELTSSYGLSRETLARILAEEGAGPVRRPISEDALELAIRRYLMGEPMSHIAQALGIGADTLFRRVRAAAPFITYTPSEELRCQIHKGEGQMIDFDTSSTSSPGSASSTGSGQTEAKSGSRAAGFTTSLKTPGRVPRTPR